MADKTEQFTSGQWIAEFSEYGGYDCMTGAWRIRKPLSGGVSGFRLIADIDLCGYGQSANSRPYQSEEAEANAHLIAAAPQLYEALKGFMDALANPKPDLETGINAIKHAYELGRAALSAALGGK